MKNDDKHIDFNEQVVKYLSGELDASAKKHFEALLAADPELNELFLQQKKIWDGVDELAEQSKYDMDAEWSLLEGKIDFEEKKVRVIPLRRTFLRIAAALIIGLAGVAGYIVLTDTLNYEQVALESGTQTIELPDGSVVTLNAGSLLKYSMDESKPRRRVILKGEAFFEVARDTSRPFRIEAGSALVEVLGTSFNVKAYENTETIEVTVRSGLVSMASKKDEDMLILLNPGNVGKLNRDGKDLKLMREADPNNFAWKTRELVFSDTPLSEVVAVLSHVYQVEVVLGSEDIADFPLTVSFNQQDLAAVMNVIVNTLDLEMKRENGQIVLYEL